MIKINNAKFKQSILRTKVVAWKVVVESVRPANTP